MKRANLPEKVRVDALNGRKVRDAALDALAASVVADGVAPCAAVGCASVTTSGSVSWRFGGALERVFDLASVTKPLLAVAAARARLPLDAPLERFVPEVTGARAARASLESLFAHRAGLAGHLPLFLLAYGDEARRGESYEGARLGSPYDRARFDRETAWRLAADSRASDASDADAGGAMHAVYSDMGYALAGEALARHAQCEDAGAAIEALVRAPLVTWLGDVLGEAYPTRLGTRRTLGPDAPYVPTEHAPFRGGLLVGEVHDENAWAFSGVGGSGHAGMFGTIDAVVGFGVGVLLATYGHGPFAGTDLGWTFRPRPGGTLRAGFDGKSASGSSAGACLGPRAFGHLGFTGTSVWIDPDARVVVALLTNRVSPSRDNLKIREARPRVHDALFRVAASIRQE
jgi:CubicO group peptidase (beta-lactamase class C family)